MSFPQGSILRLSVGRRFLDCRAAIFICADNSGMRGRPSGPQATQTGQNNIRADIILPG
jgi:hypothetical protein